MTWTYRHLEACVHYLEFSIQYDMKCVTRLLTYILHLVVNTPK